jgi:hypothetical protein
VVKRATGERDEDAARVAGKGYSSADDHACMRVKIQRPRKTEGQAGQAADVGGAPHCAVSVAVRHACRGWALTSTHLSKRGAAAGERRSANARPSCTST